MSDQIPTLPRYLHAAGGLTRFVATSEAFADAIVDGYVVDPNTLSTPAEPVLTNQAGDVVTGSDEVPGPAPEPVADDVEEPRAKKKKVK